MTTLNQARVQSLLAYLLLHCHTPQARHHLAFNFWPDLPESQARNNLRQLLHQLRQALPDAETYIHADANSVRWVASAPFALDVAAFEEAARRALMQSNELARAADRRAAIDTLQSALELYAGDLLPSCYDDWIAPERERRRLLAQQLCQQLIGVLEGEREISAALAVARRLLQLDPLDETTYVTLMRLHASKNDRAGALHIYHDCVTLLQRELGVEPGDEVQATYQRLLHLEAQQQSAPTRLSPTVGSTPLVGRHAEWERVQMAWQTASRGQPLFALISGEAGIGKSRLAEELFEWARRQGIASARTRAYAAEGRLSYAPLVEWLRSPAFAPALARLEKVWLGEVARLLPELLVRHPDLPPPGPLSEYWQRQRFFEALARSILAHNAPILLLIDDLQWCDQETLEWLHFLLRFDPKARLLLLGTVRSEEMNGNDALMTLLRALQRSGQVQEVPLFPLDADEVATLAGRMSQRAVDSAESLHLYRESEGNPLFVIEMVRAGLHPQVHGSELRQESAPSDRRAHSTVPLPPKLYALIAGRFNQLSDVAYDLVELAATIGRAFTLAVLTHASSKDEETLVNALDELWQRRIIREQGINAYDFSHDKLRDVAYAEVSPMRRRRLHRQVAQALELVHAADLDAVSGQLAAHYEFAGLTLQAIRYYRRAGAVAQRIYANAEAINLYNKAVALLAEVAAGLERAEQELALQTDLVVPLATHAGYSSPDLLNAGTRALTLASQLGRAPDPSVLRALAIGSLGQRHFAEAQAFGEELHALAAQQGDGEQQDSILFTEAYYVLGVTSFFQGEFGRARDQLERAIAHYDPANSPVHIARYAQDPKVVCLSRLALTLWYLGYPDQAAATSQEALRFAEQLGHPFSLAYCLFWSALLQQHIGNQAAMLYQVERGLALIQAHQIGTFSHWISSLSGWAQAEAGNLAEGMATLQQGVDEARAAGILNLESFFLGLMAELHSRQGDHEDALRLLSATLALMEQPGERWCMATLMRVQGEVLRRRSANLTATNNPTGDLAESEGAFVRAMALAHAQQAKSVELAAALSLAHLWRDIGRSEEARQLLGPLYGWFSEGFDTPILQEAKRLLFSNSPPTNASTNA